MQKARLWLRGGGKTRVNKGDTLHASAYVYLVVDSIANSRLDYYTTRLLDSILYLLESQLSDSKRGHSTDMVNSKHPGPSTLSSAKGS